MSDNHDNPKRGINKKQVARKAFVITGFLLLPVVLNYLSPYLIIAGAAQAVLNGSAIVFLIFFLSSLVIGRYWCGWMCPGGGFGEICTRVQPKPVKNGRLNAIKYIFVFIPWMTVILIFLVMAGGYSSVDFFWNPGKAPGDPIQIISVVEPYSYIIYYAVVGGIFVLNLAAGKRAFCHYGCWMAPFLTLGTKIKNVLKYPSYHIEADTSLCKHCKKCNDACQMSLDVERIVNEKQFVDSVECIMCGSCVAACPTGTLKTTWRWHLKKEEEPGTGTVRE